MDVGSNAERQNEEVEVLQSIYSDAFTVLERAGRGMTLRIVLPLDDRCEAALKVYVPPTYPDRDPPVFELLGMHWLAPEQREHIAVELHRLYEGDVVLFQWVQWLIDSAPRPPRRAAAPSLPAPSADLAADADADGEAQEAANSFTGTAQIVHGEVFIDRKSKFQAHVAAVASAEEVDAVVHTLLQDSKIARATHNVMAYRIVHATGGVLAGNDDDGEKAAGSRLAHLLEMLGVTGAVVVVSRWFGGILLGPDRFKHIQNCARQLLEAQGLTVDRSGKRGGKRK